MAAPAPRQVDVQQFHRDVQRPLEAVMWNFEQEIGPKMASRQVVAREGIERRAPAWLAVTGAVVWQGGRRRHDWYSHARIRNNNREIRVICSSKCQFKQLAALMML